MPPTSTSASWESSWEPGSICGDSALKEALYYGRSLPVDTMIIGDDTIVQLEGNARLASDPTAVSTGRDHDHSLLFFRASLCNVLHSR